MQTQAYTDLTLLVDGQRAFAEILHRLGKARRAIHINMFVWRDDYIGNRMGEAVLSAANRGVKVFISVDRYAVVLEKAEEVRKSFFHKEQTLGEKLKAKALKILYPARNAPKNTEDVYTELYKRIMSHPNIKVEKDIFKGDHSKYYIIDDEILFLGGINIEDKENGCDMQGRVYQDYMVKLVGKAHVEAFRAKLQKGLDVTEDYFFGVNLKGQQERFEMEALYLHMINTAQRQLYITMGYFSPLKKFVDAIVKAYERGVQVVIMIPAWANFQNDANRKTVRKIMRRTNDGVAVYFSPKMVHTKLIVGDGYISLGSTNITKKAFKQLSELNIFIPNVPSFFRDQLFLSMNENYALCRKISTYKEIEYNRMRAFFEGFIV